MVGEIEMAFLSSRPPLSSLLASPSRPATSAPPLLRAQFPHIPLSRTTNVSICAPGKGQWSLLQALRRCKSSDSSPPDSISTSSRIFVKGSLVLCLTTILETDNCNTIERIMRLPRSTSEGYLRKIFSFFGEVSRVKIMTSKTSKESLGFAYIWFTCEENARLAVEEMDGKFVDGRFITVVMARPEAPTRQRRAIPYKF